MLSDAMCVHVAEMGPTSEIALEYARKLLPNATTEQCKYLVAYGRTKEVSLLFLERLLPEVSQEERDYIIEHSRDAAAVQYHEDRWQFYNAPLCPQAEMLKMPHKQPLEDMRPDCLL